MQACKSTKCAVAAAAAAAAATAAVAAKSQPANQRGRRLHVMPSASPHCPFKNAVTNKPMSPQAPPVDSPKPQMSAPMSPYDPFCAQSIPYQALGFLRLEEEGF